MSPLSNHIRNTTMNVHESDLYYMRGSGVGSIFSNIFRGLKPLIPLVAKKVMSLGKRALQSDEGQRLFKAAKKTAINTGLDIAHDTLRGDSLKSATKNQLKDVRRKLINNLSDEFGENASTRGGRRRRKKKAVKAKKSMAKASTKKRRPG